jgi:hypothetical protein
VPSVKYTSRRNNKQTIIQAMDNIKYTFVSQMPEGKTQPPWHKHKNFKITLVEGSDRRSITNKTYEIITINSGNFAIMNKNSDGIQSYETAIKLLDKLPTAETH